MKIWVINSLNETWANRSIKQSAAVAFSLYVFLCGTPMKQSNLSGKPFPDAGFSFNKAFKMFLGCELNAMQKLVQSNFRTPAAVFVDEPLPPQYVHNCPCWSSPKNKLIIIIRDINRLVENC